MLPIDFTKDILKYLLSTHQSIPPTSIDAPKPAAVLFSFYFKNDEPWLLLTQRKAHLKKHPGQISFAGGAIEKGETPQACAIRESFEEINLLPNQIETIGYLDNINTKTGFLIVPVVGFISDINNICANQAEVEKIITLPWSFITKKDNWFDDVRELSGYRIAGKAFDWEQNGNKNRVWGITAQLIYSLAYNFFERD